jgi:hypothetical protein
MTSEHIAEYQSTCCEVEFGFVSELCHIPPETLGQHGDLRVPAEPHRCCVKSLIRSVLVGFGMRQHARKESLSKRALSTTPTSLRFRINELRGGPEQCSAKPSFKSCCSAMRFRFSGLPTRKAIAH